MAVYLPSAKIAVEIVDDPTSLPADLSAFPDFTIVPITRADLRSPAARDRTVKRIARMAANKPTRTPHPIHTTSQRERRPPCRAQHPNASASSCWTSSTQGSTSPKGRRPPVWRYRRAKAPKRNSPRQNSPGRNESRVESPKRNDSRAKPLGGNDRPIGGIHA